jgi:hypothetical protein
MRRTMYGLFRQLDKELKRGGVLTKKRIQYIWMLQRNINALMTQDSKVPKRFVRVI